MCSIVKMFTVLCMYVSGLWELWFVGICPIMCSQAATARPTIRDALRASVYLLALPLDVRTHVRLVFVSVHRSSMYILCIRSMAPRLWVGK